MAAAPESCARWATSVEVHSGHTWKLIPVDGGVSARATAAHFNPACVCPVLILDCHPDHQVPGKQGA